MEELTNNEIIDLTLYKLNNGIIQVQASNYMLIVNLGDWDLYNIKLSKVDGVWELTDYSQ